MYADMVLNNANERKISTRSFRFTRIFIRGTAHSKCNKFEIEIWFIYKLHSLTFVLLSNKKFNFSTNSISWQTICVCVRGVRIQNIGVMRYYQMIVILPIESNENKRMNGTPFDWWIDLVFMRFKKLIYFQNIEIIFHANLKKFPFQFPTIQYDLINEIISFFSTLVRKPSAASLSFVETILLWMFLWLRILSSSQKIEWNGIQWRHQTNGKTSLKYWILNKLSMGRLSSIEQKKWSGKEEWDLGIKMTDIEWDIHC